MFTFPLLSKYLQLYPPLPQSPFVFFIKSFHYAIRNVPHRCGLQPFLGLHDGTSGVMLHFSALKSFAWLFSNLPIFF